MIYVPFMYYYRCIMFRKFFLVFLLIQLSTNSVFAFSNCQIKYDSHPKSLPQLRGMCNVCHISPSGSGPQNEFGTAFKNAGFMITDEIVKKFPNLFQEEKDKGTEAPPDVTPPVSEKPEPTSDVTPSVTGEDIEKPEPFIRKVVPKRVRVNIESTLRIKGANFLEGVKAVIDNSEVIADFKSDMLLFVNFVFDSLGLHDLKVQNPDGQESNTAKIKVTGAKQ